MIEITKLLCIILLYASFTQDGKIWSYIMVISFFLGLALTIYQPGDNDTPIRDYPYR